MTRISLSNDHQAPTMGNTQPRRKAERGAFHTPQSLILKFTTQARKLTMRLAANIFVGRNLQLVKAAMNDERHTAGHQPAHYWAWVLGSQTIARDISACDIEFSILRT